MATATMATAVGAAALLYYALKRRVSETGLEVVSEGASASSTVSTRAQVRLGLARHAPSTWFEAIATLSETLRFTYSETLGKWPIADLAFGINFLMKRQGQSQAASIYVGERSEELKGPEILSEMKELIHLITACIHFSKKPFPQFLEATGYSQECVLLQEPKAGLLKPAFTILVDDKLECILLLIRGTHSVKDTLTAVTGAVVPFHHTVLDEDGVGNIVLGYAHCGMVAAARWMSQLATPVLLQAQKDHPLYTLKIVGHSLGGGTAALLTYILREKRDFSSVNCICFAPAACMTWELAESGKPFTTSVVNGLDIVPTFSAASMDDLRAEVNASAWINDLREQIERVQFLKTVMRSTSALGSRISSISRPLYPYLEDAAKAGVATWKPVSSGTQVVMRRAQTVVKSVVKTRPSLKLPGWSCMGARRRTVAISNLSLGSGSSGIVERAEDINVIESRELLHGYTASSSSADGVAMYHEEERQRQTYDGDDMLLQGSLETQFDEDGVTADDDLDLSDSHTERGDDLLTEEYLLRHLENELNWEDQQERSISDRREEEEVAKKLTQEEEEEVAEKTAKVGSSCIVTDTKAQGRELNRFFPPGRIIHILPVIISRVDEEIMANNVESTSSSVSSSEGILRGGSRVGVFSTERALYGKVRLSRTMINDHYMPNYRRMMETFVKECEQNNVIP